MFSGFIPDKMNGLIETHFPDTIHQHNLAERIYTMILTTLYRYFITHELVYVYLEDAQVKGFISASLSTNKVMRRFITSSPTGLLHILIAVIRRPSLLKSIYETYSSTRTVSRLSSTSTPTAALPTVELLSIVVASTTRQGGIGTRLLTAPESDFKGRGIEHYKVVAGSKLIGANRFYIKNGFEKVARVKIHGEEESNVYVKRVGVKHLMC
jgi:N-acetylglutamate synthase-like GNAT family acetyltransferase